MSQINSIGRGVATTGLSFFLVLTMWLGGIAQSPISGLPHVRVFHSLEYRGGIQNWSIAQDSRGIIYVANNFGLLEFDGVTWQTLGVPNGTKVRSVAIDGTGRIFVGSQGDFGYFFPNESGQLVYTSLADSLESQYRNFDEAWSIYVDNETVYFCTFSRIYVFNGGSFTVVDNGKPLDFSFLINRTLFVNIRGTGLCRLSGEKLEPVTGGNFFSEMSISGLLPVGNEQFLISTFQHGMFLLSNGKAEAWSPHLQPFFREAGVNCFARLRNGLFAVGTQNKGLLLLDDRGNVRMELTRGRGLENRTVLGLYEDDASNLWVGQNNGIGVVELGSPFSFISEQSGLPGTGYAAYLDGDMLYLGTNTGLYRKPVNEQGDFMPVQDGEGQIYHIGKYRDNLLVGQHKGAHSLDEKMTRISREPGSWIFMVMRNHPGKLLEGTYAGLQLYHLHDGRWVFHKKLNGFNESARIIAEDDNGEIWVTHGYKGVYRITLNDAVDSIVGLKHYGHDDGFSSNLLINVFRIRNELVFTSESGIFRFDRKRDTFVKDSFYSSLLGENAQIWFMQEDAFGNIYLTGTNHIGVLRKNAIGQYTYEEDAFNRIKPFLNDDLVNITILQNNEVLFGAKDGFVHFEPGKKNNATPNPQTFIRRVSVSGAKDSVIFHGNWSSAGHMASSQPEDSDVSLAYEFNSIHFSFAAAGYHGTIGREYQYYLEDFEKGWSDWVQVNQKEYTNLKEGSYTFHVRSRNSSGVVTPAATFKFTIVPPWYRSVVAYVVYSLFTVAMLLAAFNVLDKKYQREQKILKAKQEHQLNLKETEIEMISDRSQKEINRLQHEKLEADLRHMNNELATATMHLLNKNEFITGVKNHLNVIIRKNASEESKKELLQITRDIENNISADKDWEHFQFHFDRVHGDFTHRFKAAFPVLSPQDIKLSAYLRMNLSTKEIAQLLNISVRGVEISRYRLRKKLQLDRAQNLQDFILNF